MTYKEKFVTVIKCRGKIMREYGSTVRIPFGSEYSIYMKNLHTRRAVVDVSVDGDDTLDGKQVVLDAGSTLNLKGFMKGTRVRKKFRFINKTKEISRYRGDRIDDGIVRVEFRFEKKHIIYWEPPTPITPKTYSPDWEGTNWPSAFRGHRINDPNSTGGDCSYMKNYEYSATAHKGHDTQVMCSFTDGSIISKSEEGITVKGSETNQQFAYTTVGALEPTSEVIVIKLVGKNKYGRGIRKPITTKTKITCPTCGRRWRSSMKYCGNCSTYIG